MPPQPLSSYRSDVPIYTSAGAACDHRPDHAGLAARIVGHSASLDSYLASMLVTFLGASAKPSFAMYDALHQTAQGQALRAAAKSVLEPEASDLFLALLRLSGSADKHRNRLSHWLWAYSEAIEDGLLLIDPAANFRFLVEVTERVEQGDVYGDGLRGVDRSRVLVYKRADLMEVVWQYERVSEWFRTFKAHLTPHPLHAAPGWRWHQLATSQEVQEALRRVTGRACTSLPRPPKALRTPPEPSGRTRSS